MTTSTLSSAGIKTHFQLTIVYRADNGTQQTLYIHATHDIHQRVFNTFSRGWYDHRSAINVQASRQPIGTLAWHSLYGYRILSIIPPDFPQSR